MFSVLNYKHINLLKQFDAKKIIIILSPYEQSKKGSSKFNWKKNPHTPVNGVKEFVCLSLVNFDPNHLKTGRTEGAENKFATLAARAVFVGLFLLKKQLIYDFLAANNYPYSPHSQRGMKFATQISPLLNYYYFSCQFE